MLARLLPGVQLAALRRVGRSQQAGRVQRQALVVDQVRLAREGVLQHQTLQLLRQDRLAAAQVRASAHLGGRAATWVGAGLAEGGGASVRLRKQSPPLADVDTLPEGGAPYLLPQAALGSALPAGEAAYELLQTAELQEQSWIQGGATELQLEAAAGQDERRVAVEALQDVSCREGGPSSWSLDWLDWSPPALTCPEGVLSLSGGGRPAVGGDLAAAVLSQDVMKLRRIQGRKLCPERRPRGLDGRETQRMSIR